MISSWNHIYKSLFFAHNVMFLCVEGSILGGILLIGGLYSVLWGKSRESMSDGSCSEMNKIDGAQDEQDHNKTDAAEEGRSAAAGEKVRWIMEET
jgi:hypothetical protein